MLPALGTAGPHRQREAPLGWPRLGAAVVDPSHPDAHRGKPVSAGMSVHHLYVCVLPLSGLNVTSRL